MINSVLFWWVLFIIYVGAVVSSAIRAWQRGGVKHLKYDLKNAWNNLTWILNMFVACYVIVIGTIPIKYIVTWVNDNINSSVPWMRSSVSVVYVLILMLVMVLIMFRGLIPRIKYNEEEKQWEKENKERNKNRIRQWLHIKPKTEQK